MRDSCRNMIEYYRELYRVHGVSPDSLGWHKGNQNLRFEQLVLNLNLNRSSILDVGCGFGDFIEFLEMNHVEDYRYTGIDIVEEFISESRMKFSSEHLSFYHSSLMEYHDEVQFDYAIASGTFNFKIDGIDRYDYIHSCLKKMLELSSKAISVDLLTDRVDFFHDHNFNFSPMKILDIGYSLSKRVILNNSVFPFEFTVTIYKNDSFDKASTVFTEVKNKTV